MTYADFSPLQYDLLREKVNVAMGIAGSGLSDLLSTFVNLSVPMLRIVPAGSIAEWIVETSSQGRDATTFRQEFQGAIDGEAIVSFDESSPVAATELAELTGEEASRGEQLDVLREMSNIVVYSCVGGIARHLFAAQLGFGPTTLVEEKSSVSTVVQRLFSPAQLPWRSALVIRVPFALEDRKLSCDLTILLSERSIETVGRTLDAALATLLKHS